MMTNKIIRCALYIRVSTAEQCMHGKSLDAQESYLQQYASDHNMIWSESTLTRAKLLVKSSKNVRLYILCLRM